MASADSVSDAIKHMESNVDAAFDAMRQPCSGEDHRAAVESMVSQCDQQRPKLEEMAMMVIDQAGGDRIFNEITLVLDRLERLKDQKEAWARAPPTATGGSSGGAGGEFPSPDRMPSGGQIGASSGYGGSGVAAGMAAYSSPGAGGYGSPVHSQAPSSIPDFEVFPQRDSSSEVAKKEKRKKDKKDRRSKSESADAFGFMPSGSGGLGGEADGGARGGGASSSAFGAWPSAAPGQASQDGETWPGTAAATPPPGSGADGAFGAWGDGGGGFDAFGSSAWGAGPSDRGFDAGSAAPGAAGGFDAHAAASSSSVAHGAPASSSFGAFGEAAGSAALPEDPPGDAGGMWGDTLGSASGAIGGGGTARSASIAEAPGAESARMGSVTQPLGSGLINSCGGFGSGRNGSEGAYGATAGQKATLLIRRPYKEVEHDRAAFERVFVSEVARAVGVPAHRIRVRAVRPGV